MPPPPTVNRRIIEALLGVELPHAEGRRLVLVHGRYDDQASPEFTTQLGGVPRRVLITDQPSVLGIVEAWQHHQATTGDSDDVLVVTTRVDDAQLGWDLRGHAVGRATRTVDRAEIVRQRFGAADLDPRIRRESWLVDALLDAEPAGGWPPESSLLTRDAAVRAVLRARLGTQAQGDGTVDAETLFAWSRTSTGPARFALLPGAERAGMTRWLTETVGDVVPVLLGLAAAGRGPDAMALGVVASVLAQPDASAEAALAVGGLLGDVRPRPAQLRSFTNAVQDTLTRWVAEAERADPGNASSNDARHRVLEVVTRADELAASAGPAQALATNRFLPSGFQARLRQLAAALSPRPAAVVAAQRALSELEDHGLAPLYPQRVRVARLALRLTRWLGTPEPSVTSVAGGVRGHLNEWGWVDRALTVVWAGDPVADAAVGQAYQAVYQAARTRRDALDEAFARRLVTWTAHAGTPAPGGCLLVEDVLQQVALPLTGLRAPLIVVLDGMSSAVATELGEQLARQSWIEVSPLPGQRPAAVSAIPSVTGVSRASLLTGTLTSGDQVVERDGFAAFWRRHRHHGVLVHQAAIGGDAGHRLAGPLVEALAGEDVVGVVLNTVDDALRYGREGDRTQWRLADVTYLPELLDAARGYGRPVLLVSDHGHVLERSVAASGPVAASGAESARWRTGTAGEGEVELAGPRVLRGNGRIVASWREDIRYTPRRAGYHGGAALAEMTVPLLVVLPAVDLLPPGWSVLPPESTVPSWWTDQGWTRSPDRESPTTPPAGPPITPVPAPTLGTQVVATEIYAAQRGFVRKAPDRPIVAAVIDALVAADGTLSLAAVVAEAGRGGRNPEFFAATLERLLNVERYPVLDIVDGGRALKLDVALLRLQFGLDPS